MPCGEHGAETQRPTSSLGSAGGITWVTGAGPHFPYLWSMVVLRRRQWVLIIMSSFKMPWNLQGKSWLFVARSPTLPFSSPPSHASQKPGWPPPCKLRKAGGAPTFVPAYFLLFHIKHNYCAFFCLVTLKSLKIRKWATKGDSSYSYKTKFKCS